MSEIFLDTETTGLSHNDGHRIVEVACVETNDLVASGNVFHKIINLVNFMQIIHSSAYKQWFI